MTPMSATRRVVDGAGRSGILDLGSRLPSIKFTPDEGVPEWFEWEAARVVDDVWVVFIGPKGERRFRETSS